MFAQLVDLFSLSFSAGVFPAIQKIILIQQKDSKLTPIRERDSKLKLQTMEVYICNLTFAKYLKDSRAVG